MVLPAVGDHDGWRLTGNASGDDNDVSASESLLEAIVGRKEALDLGDGGDVGEVGGHAGSVDDIVEGELVNERASLKKEGQRLRGDVSECALRERKTIAWFLPVRYHQRRQRRLLISSLASCRRASVSVGNPAPALTILAVLCVC